MSNPFPTSKFEAILLFIAMLLPYNLGEKVIEIGYFLYKYWIAIATFLITAIVITTLFLVFK